MGTQREEPGGSWGGRHGFLGRDTWGRRRDRSPPGRDARGGRNKSGRLPGTCQDANRSEHSGSPGEGMVGVRLPKRPQPDSKKSRVRTQLKTATSDGLGMCRVTKGKRQGL